MVTAGVYMVARAHVLYTLAPLALTVVACVGLATALLSATIGLTQFDIKRVLAYSTVSQLGYMFLGLGVGAFGAAIFHLMTHAFFKALLFLGAGSVMHAMSNHTDMRLMGGLKSKMPITYGTMVIGTLAIAGFPGFSGFFSKDEILWQSYAGLNGHPLFWLLGALAAGLTAFYMFRLIFMTFHGKLRLQDEQVHAIHESPRIMTIPLVMLAILSLAGGYVGVPALLGGGQRIEHFLQPVFQQSEQLSHGLETSKPSLHAHSMEWLLMLTVFLVTLISLYLAYLFYIKKTDLPGRLVKKISGLYALVYNKYFIDEAYDVAIVRLCTRPQNPFYGESWTTGSSTDWSTPSAPGSQPADEPWRSFRPDPCSITPCGSCSAPSSCSAPGCFNGALRPTVPGQRGRRDRLTPAQSGTARARMPFVQNIFPGHGSNS